MVAEAMDLFGAEREKPPAWWSTDHWITPPEFVRTLEAEFGPFTLDPCALPISAKAPKFYSPADNGLMQPWAGTIWCNPPFSKPRPWILKAIQARIEGHTVVMLLPVKTDTLWFHDLVQPNAEVRFLKGRLAFHGWKGTPLTRARFPNMLAIFWPNAYGGKD